MMDQSIIKEYEKTLLGDKRSVSKYFFSSYTNENNEKTALMLFRYALCGILKWSPEKIKNELNYKLICDLKLKSVYKYIRFPSELDRKKDCYYVAHLLFPEAVPVNERDLIIKTYEDVLNGRMKKFPKEYFTGVDGIIRSQVCLQHLLNEYCEPFESVEELYHFFSSSKASQFLRDYKLRTICTKTHKNPLNYLHNSLPMSQKNNFYFSYYRYQSLIKANKKEKEIRRLIR